MPSHKVQKNVRRVEIKCLPHTSLSFCTEMMEKSIGFNKDQSKHVGQHFISGFLNKTITEEHKWINALFCPESVVPKLG